jgi:hypothetical protein
MRRIVSSWRYVTVAVHVVCPIRPMIWKRGSPTVRAGRSTRSLSSQIACASTKSIACFALFAADFAGSKSNRGKVYKLYYKSAPHASTISRTSARRKRTVTGGPEPTR